MLIVAAYCYGMEGIATSVLYPYPKELLFVWCGFVIIPVIGGVQI